jgi:hypothetical protein
MSRFGLKHRNINSSMDDSPLDELLKNLEESLVNLLQSVRGDPWSLLIFQTLIWSFRRWAVYYLVSEDMDTNMHDYLWDSHIELVKEHAPEGLKDFGVVWLNPTNVGDRVDSLEELNSYFLFIVDKLNHAIDTENEDEQNLLAIFLDDTITDIIGEWLEGRTEYRIYPDHNESSEHFSSEKIFSIMQIILEKNARPRTNISLPPSTIPPAKLETLHEPVVHMYNSIPVSEAPVSHAPVSEAPVSEAPVSEAPVSEAPVSEAPVSQALPPIEFVAPAQKPLHMTIAAALKRRKTLRLHGRRSESNQPPNRASTRRRAR